MCEKVGGQGTVPLFLLGGNMKKKKRILIALLVAVLASSSVMVSYNDARQVKAVAIADDLLILLTLMAGAGIVYVGSNLAENWVQDLEDDKDNIINMYDSAVWQKYNEGLTPNPDDFDPDEDDPSEHPTTFEKFKQWWQTHPQLASAVALTGALGSVLASFKQNFNAMKYKSSYVSDDVPADVFEVISDYVLDFPYVLVTIARNNSDITRQYNFYLFSERVSVSAIEQSNGTEIHTSNQTWFREIVHHANGNSTVYEVSSTVEGDTHGDTYIDTASLSHKIYPAYGNVPVFYVNSVDEVVTDYPEEMVDPVPAWVDSLGQATETENPNAPKFDEVQLPNPQLNPVTQEQIEKLLEDLRKAEQLPQTQKDPAIQEAVDDFINPAPQPEPAPDPAPDVGLDEDISASDVDKNQFLLPEWITERFPFCIPFDLINAVELLNSSGRSAPRYEFPIKVTIAGIDEKIVVDLSEFDEVAEICRRMELLLFVIGLVLITRDLIKG